MEQSKLDVLCRVARALNQRQVVWAVGGSLMLYFKGVVTDFRDIDLMVAKEDGDRAAEALSALGAIARPIVPNARFQSDGFWKFSLNHVDLDMIAGFNILFQGQKYAFPLREGDIKDNIMVRGESIPLHGVEEWREYYRLMGRPEKVELIDKWTAKNAAPNGAEA